MSEENKTYPVDYREILKISNRPVIVGGQAVNLWASMYVPVAGKARYGSFDLDLLSSPSLLEELKRRFFDTFNAREPFTARCG
jgi:hypothetical protein